ncbi:MAG: hypothetical protein ACRC7O_12530 [Fimbriiglobus sp.]
MPPRPLVVFADDWGRHPSSCQHLVRHLLGRRPVVWVNTIGTRPLRPDRATAARAAGKLRQWFAPNPATAAPAGPAPLVVAPKMWPSFRSPPARRLNRWLLTRGLARVFADLPEPPVVVTTLPIVADLVGRLPAAGWVYYCVDDFSEWPGYDGATLQRMERDLVPKMDAAIAVSEPLQRHLAGLGRPADLLTHGVDLDVWNVPPSPEIPPEFAGLEPPFVLFWGVIDGRTDVDFVARLASTMTQGTVVLVGPTESPPARLFGLPRVAVRPSAPFARLPHLAAAAGVLVMPYADLPVTRAFQPLKLKEYLATGRSVVVRDLPATQAWADAADLAATPEAFAAFVMERLAGGLPGGQRFARGRLAAEGWDGKATMFESVIARIGAGGNVP